MANAEDVIENPLVKQLIDRGESAAVVPIDGFVGPSGDADHVRVYRDLTLTTCVDIPRDAVIRSVSPKDNQPTDPSILFVDGAAVVNLTSKTRIARAATVATTLRLDLARVDELGAARRAPQKKDCSCGAESPETIALARRNNNSGVEHPPMDCEIRCEMWHNVCGDGWWCWIERWLCDAECNQQGPKLGGAFGTVVI